MERVYSGDGTTVALGCSNDPLSYYNISEGFNVNYSLYLKLVNMKAKIGRAHV